MAYYKDYKDDPEVLMWISVFVIIMMWIFSKA